MLRKDRASRPVNNPDRTLDMLSIIALATHCHESMPLVPCAVAPPIPPIGSVVKGAGVKSTASPLSTGSPHARTRRQVVAEHDVAGDWCETGFCAQPPLSRNHAPIPTCLATRGCVDAIRRRRDCEVGASKP